MKFFTTDQNGITLVDPSEEARLQVLQSIRRDPHADFPEVHLSGKNGIVIGYRHDGCLLLEESGETTRYLSDSDIETAMRAWNLLIENKLDELNSLDWVNID